MLSLKSLASLAIAATLLPFAGYVLANSHTESPPKPETASKSATTLLEAYQLARESDPNLAIARLRVDGAEAQREAARGRTLPQVSAFGQWSENYLEFHGQGSVLNPDQDYPGERYGVSVSQSILNMRDFQEFGRAASAVELSEEELKVAEADMLSLMVEVYLGVLLADVDYTGFLAELEALEQQLEEANALYDKNLLPVTQVLETQTRTEAIRADVIEARGRADIARERLYQLTGDRSVEPSMVAELVNLVPLAANVEEAAERAMASSATVKAAEQAIEVARGAIEREKGAFYPDVTFTASQQYSDVGFDNLQSPPRTSKLIQLSVNYPLFEGGSGSARLRGAWAEFYSAQQRLEGAKREAITRARSAWVNLMAASERVGAAKQGLKTAETSLDASRKAVKAGTARVADVLMALAQTTRARRDFAEARFMKAMGWLELALAMGEEPLELAPTLSSALHEGVTKTTGSKKASAQTTEADESAVVSLRDFTGMPPALEQGNPAEGDVVKSEAAPVTQDFVAQPKDQPVKAELTALGAEESTTSDAQPKTTGSYTTWLSASKPSVNNAAIAAHEAQATNIQ